MRRPAFSPATFLLSCALLAAGCEQKPKINYVALTQAGYSTTMVDDLKKLKITESEIPQIVKLKTVGLSDDTSLALVQDAHSHQHSFSSGDSAGNLIGAAAPDASILLAARIVEGIGFFGAVLAIPSTLARVVDENRRDFVMAAWSAYMPTGIMLMLLLGPLLASTGWRAIWQFNAFLAAACSLLLALYAPELPRRTDMAAGRLLTQVARVLRHRQSVTLAIAFFAYSCQIFSMAFALPLVLTSAHGVALGSG